ncbi:MAG: hypothetical protein Q9174_005855, partial [Haloplaca sp. 1 TL-2023]
GISTGVGKNADNELSLIDFDADLPPPTSSAPEASSQMVAPKEESLEDDLLGLSFQDKPYGQSGGIALGFGSNTSEMKSQNTVTQWLMVCLDVPGPSLLSSSTQQNSARQPSPTPTPQFQQPPPAIKPNYDPFASITSSLPTSRSGTPKPAFPQTQPASSDPFAALASKPPQQPSPAPSASMFNFASPKLPTPSNAQQSNGASSSAAAASVDDDWNFASALPAEGSSLPTTNEVIVSQNAVTVAFKASRTEKSESPIAIMASYSNNTAQLVTEYTFQVAVTKAYTLNLTPQSGRTLQPKQQNGITQPIEVNGVPRGSGNNVKMRWKASYKLGGEAKMDQGEKASVAASLGQSFVKEIRLRRSVVPRLHTFSTRHAYRPNALSLATQHLRSPKSTVYKIQPYRGLIDTTFSPKNTSSEDADASPEKSSTEALVKVRDIPAPHVGHIRVITLNSPRNKNAISRQLLKELHDQLRKIRHQSWVESKAWKSAEDGVSMGQGTRAIVIGSEVDGVFCAGADLKERAGMSLEEVKKFLNELRYTLGIFEESSVPTISAVSSLALGGGLELALATNFRVFTPATVVGLPETRLGIIPGAGGTVRLPKYVGTTRALDMVLTGRRLDGKEAYEMGLCDRLCGPSLEEIKEKNIGDDVPRQEAMEGALTMARSICEGGPATTWPLMRIMHQDRMPVTEESREWAEHNEGSAYEGIVRTYDRDEALLAFKEKRKPVFTGRLKAGRLRTSLDVVYGPVE